MKTLIQKIKIGAECFKELPKNKYVYTSLRKVAKKYNISEVTAGHYLDIFMAYNLGCLETEEKLIQSEGKE